MAETSVIMGLMGQSEYVFCGGKIVYFQYFKFKKKIVASLHQCKRRTVVEAPSRQAQVLIGILMRAVLFQCLPIAVIV